eukprot:1145470-Pelagomonas_calceolata.AAC.1
MAWLFEKRFEQLLHLSCISVLWSNAKTVLDFKLRSGRKLPRRQYYGKIGAVRQADHSECTTFIKYLQVAAENSPLLPAFGSITEA